MSRRITSPVSCHSHHLSSLLLCVLLGSATPVRNQLQSEVKFCTGVLVSLQLPTSNFAPGALPRACRKASRSSCIRRSPRRVRFSSPDIISSDRHRWVHCPLFLLISHLPIVTVGSPVLLISAVRPPLITLTPSNVSAAPLRTTSILRRTYIREIPLCCDKSFIMASP